MMPRRSLPFPRCAAGLPVLLIGLAAAADAQVWVAQGPGPNTRGQVENIANREVVGAINAVALHPTDANTVFVGAVNGGIWKSTNAMAASPSWTRLSDFQESLSIGALEFDPTDPSRQTLLAGTGRFSSFGDGGARAGLLRTTNGGASWTSIDGGGTLDGANIIGVAPRGATLVVAATNRGILRSTDTGATWTLISGAAGSGLPLGNALDLTSDPANNARLFTNAGANGVFRSTDTGATWTLVSNAAMNALMAGGPGNFEIAVGPSNNVYAAIVTGGTLAGIFRSGDGGTTWTQMDLPTTVEGGIHLGGQGGLHLSLAADPTNVNIVYIGGDRQGGPFPNSIGAGDFSGRLFRGDASQPAGSQFVHLTHSSALGPAGGGTANNSAPHADSRDMDVAANGVLVEGDDGGIYRRTTPLVDTGDWFSMNGDIQTTEFHATAWDARSDIIIGGAQDTGTPEQLIASDPLWQSVSTADGGSVAVDDLSTPGFSTRYSSNQRLGGFRRRVYDAANVFQSQANPTLTVLAGGAALAAQFYTPIRVNTVTATRLILGAGNSVYESLDQGDTITEIGPGIVANGSGSHTIAYGAAGNPEMLYVGAGTRVFIRNAAAPAALVASAAYPGTRVVEGVAINPGDPLNAFVVDALAVFRTTDGGTTWGALTGNLLALNPGPLRAVAYSTNTADGAVIVGGDNGVFTARGCTGFAVWTRLGTGLPTAPVFELEYDAADRMLLAGTLGRGAWTVGFAGAGVGAPQIQVPGSVDFGETCVLSTRRATLNVCNTGKDDLVIDPIVSSDPQFSVTTPSSGYPVVISHDFCFPFQVNFTPAAAGPRSGTLTIPSNDPASACMAVDVSGVGTIPDIRVTGSTAFGVTSNWTPAEKTVKVCNAGLCPLSVTSASIDCTDFKLIANPFPATINADACLDLVVEFSPALQGPKSCTLTIASSDPDAPVVQRLLTARTPPFLSVHFGAVKPHGALNTVAKLGSTFTLGFVNPLGPHWAAELRLGYASFGGRPGFGDVDLWTVAGNGRYTFNPAAPARLFVNGGGGLYNFDPGDVEAGINFGVGVNVPAGRRFAFEGTYNYHWAFTASPNRRFSQFQAGMLVSF